MRKFSVLVVLVAALAGCATPFVVACRDVAQNTEGEFKYTQRQAAIACDRAQFYADPHLVMYDKDKNEWKLNPRGIFTQDLEMVMNDQAKSLDALLNYTDRESADFIDWFKGFRKGLEKEEAIVLEILRRLNYVRTYNKFTDAVGELPLAMQSKEISYFFPAGRKSYSMRILYPVRKLEGIPFTSEYLEVAKRDGTLKLVDKFEFSTSQEFAKKIPDLYDPNDFNWERQERGWAVLAYKIMPYKDKPADNVIHYLEIFRKKDMDGLEEKPAVRGFLTAGGSKVSVFIIDYDREGSPGYGSPDQAIKIFTDVLTARDIFTNSNLRATLLDALYDPPQSVNNHSKQRPERRKPRDREVYTSIVKLGEISIDMWEKGIWSVPFDYKSLSQNLEIIFDKPKTAEEKRIEERDKLKQIKLFTRDFRQDSTKVVFEYWVPKKIYAERNIATASANSDTMSIRRKNGLEERGEIGYFGDKVRMIDYRFGGKWFRIVDEDGDDIFEKRREISDPTSTNTSMPSLAGSEYGGLRN